MTRVLAARWRGGPSGRTKGRQAGSQAGLYPTHLTPPSQQPLKGHPPTHLQLVDLWDAVVAGAHVGKTSDKLQGREGQAGRRAGKHRSSTLCCQNGMKCTERCPAGTANKHPCYHPPHPTITSPSLSPTHPLSRTPPPPQTHLHVEVCVVVLLKRHGVQLQAAAGGPKGEAGGWSGQTHPQEKNRTIDMQAGCAHAGGERQAWHPANLAARRESLQRAAQLVDQLVDDLAPGGRWAGTVSGRQCNRLVECNTNAVRLEERSDEDSQGAG
jgi:hypothetical protein